MSIEKVVDVVISRETATVTRAGFGRPMILGVHTKFAEDIRVYSSLAAVADDFLTTDEEYKAAAKIFAQSPAPTDIAIGKRSTAVAQIDDIEITTLDINDYTVTINGTPFTYNAPAVAQVDSITGATDGSSQTIDVIINSTTIPWSISSSPNMASAFEELHDLINAEAEPVTASYVDDLDYSQGIYITADVAGTAFTLTLSGETGTIAADNITPNGTRIPANSSEVTNALIALINAGSEPVTASPSGSSPDENLVLTADNAGEPFTTTVTTNMTLVHTTANVGVQTDLQNIYDSGDIGKSWYALCLVSRVESDVLEAAIWIQANKRIFVTASSDVNVKSALTTDIASQLKALSYDRVAVIYSADAANYPDAAWLGRMLPKDPGSATWCHKVLTGITIDELTDTEENNLQGKNCNYYITRGGGGRTHWGYTAEGEWIDVIRGIDWIEARMQEEVYALVIAVDKIPYTNKGIGMVGTPIEQVLIQAQDREILDSYEITLPDAADFTATQKQSRILTGITFTGVLAGAVHSTAINGSVSV